MNKLLINVNIFAFIDLRGSLLNIYKKQGKV